MKFLSWAVLLLVCGLVAGRWIDPDEVFGGLLFPGVSLAVPVTASYIIYFKLIEPTAGSSQWWFGISPEGIGAVGMLLNFVVATVVSRLTLPPSDETIQSSDSQRSSIVLTCERV